MKLEDKHIDELFRSAANQSSAPEYNSSYWKEMEAMLNDSKKRRRGLIFWSGFGGILMIGLISTLFLSISNESRYNQVNLELDTELIDANSLTYPLIYSDKTTAELSSDFQNQSNNGAVSSRQIFNSKDVEAEPFNSTNTLTEFVKENNTTVDNIEKLEIEQLPLISADLGFNMERKDHLIIEQLIPTKQLPAYSPLTTSIELGGGVSQVYDNTKSNPTLMHATLKLDYKLNNFLFSSGLGVMIEQSPGISVSERAKVYGFGVTNFEHSLNYKTLVDVAIPVQVSYQAGKNTYGIGAQMRYLANSSMRFESKENGETMMADNLNGLTTGLNPLNVDTYGFYERSLSQHFSLGLRITQQLTSRIASDKYFNSLDRTKTLNGQIYLKYSLFNR